MSIPQSVIESIHQHIDIVDVISDFVPLKKKGANYWACCPFHGEKTPSFAVNPGKNIFKCFGCGISGDAIRFVMEHEKLSYPDTVRYLAKKYGIKYEEEKSNTRQIQLENERESLHIVLSYANNFYKQTLLHHEEGQSLGLSYLKERGFSQKIIQKFELGYSLNERDGLLKSALAANYKPEILEKAGLILHRENVNDSSDKKYYDRFRGRVMFPIHSITGKVIAFGARILRNDKNQPKYINSPETEVYNKSRIVYGIYQAKNEIRAKNNCYLVEGYTDVISMHQAGIENVVASSGTSLTIEQIRLIKRYCENITVLYDGDTAGIKAAMRGIDLILEEGMNVSVVLFPNQEDPDSYIRKYGAEAFRQYLSVKVKDFITFKTSVFLAEASNDPLKKAAIIKEVVNSISKIPDAIKRALFFKTCSTMLDIDEQVLITEYNKIIQQKYRKIAEKRENHIENADNNNQEVQAEHEENTLLENKVWEHELYLLKILMHYGMEKIDGQLRICDYILAETEDVENRSPLFLKVANVIRNALMNGIEISKNFFIEHPDEEIKNIAQYLSVERYSLSDQWQKFGIFVPDESELLWQTVPKYILRYKRLIVRIIMEETRKELLSKQSDEKQLDEILFRYKQLQTVSTEINKLLGIVVG